MTVPGQHRDAVRVRKDVRLNILAGADPISVTSRLQKIDTNGAVVAQRMTGDDVNRMLHTVEVMSTR
jgi:hypothetical protein